ncbi:MAG: bacteriocin fulvocin C-related protein [Bacteroidales bacterium]|nr:bacteriocin fulvocin C-related protein [Bacteroidales bacterium]
MSNRKKLNVNANNRSERAEQKKQTEIRCKKSKTIPNDKWQDTREADRAGFIKHSLQKGADFKLKIVMIKNLKLSILVISLVAITVTGCKKFEEVYSCDSATNEWVKANLSPIQKMNRQDLLELDFDKRVPTYRAFTADQKYECWVDKFEQIKSLQWTKKEFSHISYLAESIAEEWFESKSISYEIEVFLEKWVTDGMNFFGWNVYEVGCMLSCLYDIEMEDDNVVFKVPPGGVTIAKEEIKMCNCNQGILSDFCGWGERCSSITCTEQAGCSWLLLQMCNGRCKDN